MPGPIILCSDRGGRSYATSRVLTGAEERASDAVRQLLVIEPRHWLDWINPLKDNRWLADRGRMSAFSVETEQV